MRRSERLKEGHTYVVDATKAKYWGAGAKKNLDGATVKFLGIDQFNSWKFEVMSRPHIKAWGRASLTTDTMSHAAFTPIGFECSKEMI